MKDLLLTNDSEIRFIDQLKNSINKCTSFCFSVSFIKKAGLDLILKDLENALQRGVEGRLITSTYQNFTDIPSLEKFLQWSTRYPNFSCHLDIQCFGEKGYHSKGYLFTYEGSKEFIVGSSNITRFALLHNIEWNVTLSSSEKMDSFESAQKEFEDKWNKTLPLSQDLISKYRTLLDYAVEKWDMDYVDPTNNIIKPNFMQKKALKELRRYRDMGVTKALIVSATGSGKTYLAAFDARNFDAKRVLFVVHRDKILLDAKNTFQNVFGASKTYGLYVGDRKDLDADYVFASNQLLAKHLNEFEPTEFDYIVMDECHHAAASTYKKIMEYFKPEFMLGITATPERMDNEDVFALFDKNVPYELRLRDAIINDLVVPFHYFGIRDQLVNYSYKDNSIISKEIAKSENIEFIAKEIRKHQPQGKLKALAFCTTIAHCQLMAEQFNEAGFNAIALTGSNDLGERIKAFEDLQDDSKSLEIICAIDILNEGVDIPKVNMVLFLRPTESSTIFLQQLGRGLRKADGKDYVTVLDFIGNNYNRSVQIAMALGTLGQTTAIEKTYLIDLLKTDFAKLSIPGIYINIDELSKEEIIDFLKKENFNTKDFLKKDYENFKHYLKLNKYPTHMEYLNSDCSPDLMRFLKTSINPGKNRSYYTFLKKIGEESLPIFTDQQITFIDNLSEYLPLARPDEYLVIDELINHKQEKTFEKYPHVTKESLAHAKETLVRDGVLEEGYQIAFPLSPSFVEYVNDLLEYGLTRYDIEFGEFNTPFKLYANYSKKQVYNNLLEHYTMDKKQLGTYVLPDGNTYVFVGLQKDKAKLDKVNYKDKFLSPRVFQWESQNDVSLDSARGKALLQSKKVYVFVRKMDSEDGMQLPFTYFGTGVFNNPRASQVISTDVKKGKTTTHKTVLLDIVLDQMVPERYWFDFEIPEVK